MVENLAFEKKLYYEQQKESPAIKKRSMGMTQLVNWQLEQEKGVASIVMDVDETIIRELVSKYKMPGTKRTKSSKGKHPSNLQPKKKKRK